MNTNVVWIHNMAEQANVPRGWLTRKAICGAFFDREWSVEDVRELHRQETLQAIEDLENGEDTDDPMR